MERLKVIVPDSWKDVTIKQYQQFMTLIESKKSEQKKMIEGVSIFCNIETKVVKQMALKDLKKIYDIFVKMVDTENTDDKIEKQVLFNNKKYGLIPNMSEMTTGEFIDLETYCADNVINNLHKIMCVLYRPLIGDVDRFERYEVEPYKPTPEKQHDFLMFPMSNVLGVLNFFFHLGERLSTDFHNYLEELNQFKIKENQMNVESQLKKDIKINGDGIQFYMN